MQMRAGKVMSRMALKVIGALAGSAVVASGCGIGSSATPPSASSFAEVYTRVIAPTCSNDFCHYNNVGIRYSALDMSSKVYAYWGLVDQPSIGPSCSDMGTRVVPGRPDLSIMYLKVSETMPPCGSQMPADVNALLINGTSAFSGTPLADDQQQLIYNWILEGAQNN
jgi:hypothetical protein